MYVGNVKTPTMLMTGVNDLRTPMAQTEQFYEALKLRKVPTAMIRFNDEWHGTTIKPSNFMRTQLYLRNWFEKWKRGGDRKTTTMAERARPSKTGGQAVGRRAKRVEQRGGAPRALRNAVTVPGSLRADSELALSTLKAVARGADTVPASSPTPEDCRLSVAEWELSHAD